MKRIQFWHLLLGLNLLVLVLILFGTYDLVEKTASSFELLWGLICVAVTIFVDSCYQNVILKVNQKRIGFVILDLVLGMSLVVLIIFVIK